MPQPHNNPWPVPEALQVRQAGAVPTASLLDFHFVPLPGVVREGAVQVPLEALSGDREVWFGDGPARYGRIGPFTAHHSGDWLALCLSRPVEPTAIAEPTRLAYREALRIIAASDFPHLVRVWNYLPDINGGCGDAEPYRQFCSGRAAALADLGIGADELPAASALGSDAGQPLQLTFLACRHPARHLENPRQLSAYRYPPRYGRQPPSFARASVIGRRVLISGTAAIVGHESQHPGDVDRQVRCTADNLHLLLDHACAEHDARWVDRLLARVYLRHPQHLPLVRDALAADLPQLAGALFLRADVCRRELLVEVEATGVLR
jgi:chorismate lyase / 3-hydroxybenzoate synthase